MKLFVEMRPDAASASEITLYTAKFGECMKLRISHYFETCVQISIAYVNMVEPSYALWAYRAAVAHHLRLDVIMKFHDRWENLQGIVIVLSPS